MKLDRSTDLAGLPAALLVVGGLVRGAAAAGAASLHAQAEQTLAFIESQLLDTIEEVADPADYPQSTSPGTGHWITKDSGAWTSGFFPAQLWIVHEHTGNQALRSAAEDWTAGLAGEATRTDTHDLGFMIGLPFGHAFRITGLASYTLTILTAAGSLDTRFDPDVGATRSWDNDNWAFPVIIDNMMNLELLFRGAAHTSNPGLALTWLTHAVSHADVTAASHVRPDGSTYHLVDFDPDDGSILSQETVQGYGDETTWARGQAWGFNGFTMTHRESGEPRFLATAQALADWFIAHLPADFVPYWDFEALGIPDEPRDSSAAAIAASGLLELSTWVTDPLAREFYRSAAESILASLMSAEYLSDGAQTSGILLHGTGNKPNNSQVDVSLIYGDYYFTEALLRYLAITDCPWDVGGDGLVNVIDFLALLQAWGPNPGHSADFDGSGDVGTSDFLALLGHWGECP